jgi:hypothetical protein
LTTCKRDPTHVYPGHNKRCPWCAQEATGSKPPKQIALPAVRTPQGDSSLPRTTSQNSPSKQQQVRQTTPESSTFPTVVVVAACIAGVTVLIPWWIGLGTRGALFRPTSALVLSTSDRDGGNYFGTDYLAGLLVITAIASVLLLLSGIIRLRKRVARFVIGILLGALALGVWLPASSDAWAAAERVTATAEASSVPYNDDSCRYPYLNYGTGSASVVLPGEGEIPHTWTAIAVHDRSSDGTPLETCKSVEIWDGQQLVRTIATPNISDGVLVAIQGTSVDDSYFVFTATGPTKKCKHSWCQANYDVVGGFSLSATKVAWTHKTRLTYHSPGIGGVDTEAPILAIRNELLLVLTHPRTKASTATAFTVATGKVKWETRCPAKARYGADLWADVDSGKAILRCNGGPNSNPPHLDYFVSDTGKLKKRS